MTTEDITSSPESEDDSVFPGIASSALPDIDLALAEQMYAGNSKIYLRLLFRFQEHFSDRADTLLSALEKNNFEDMTHISHSIKGTAGQLCATQLSKTAEKAEHACRAQDAECALHVKSTVEHLNKVLSSLARIPGPE